jgi:hypothetical protein
MSLTLLCAPLAALLLHGAPAVAPAGSAQSAADAGFAIRAAHAATGDGQHLANVLILVQDGRLKAIGAGELPAGVQVLEYAGWVTPGFVAAWGQLGHPAEDETTSPFLEQLDLLPSFDPHRPDVAEALRVGITTLLPATNPVQVIAGTIPPVKLAAGPGGEVQRLPLPALLVSMAAASVNRGRAPTSYSGLVQALDQRAADPTGRLADAKGGRLLLSIDVEERHEVQRAIDWSTRHGLRPLLRGATLAGEQIDSLQAAGAGVVLPPFGLGASGRTLDALVALSKSRVPFAFGYGSEGSFRLPLAAALARGADRQALERALWSGAAKLIGAETRVGALRAGLDADLVLWSGDPLDLASRPERIYVAGREVYRAAPQLPSQAPKQPRLGVPPTKPHAR